MKFLFVTTARLDRRPAGDHSTRHRGFHFAEALRGLGHGADVAMLGELTVRATSAYDALVLIRPRATRRLAALLAGSRRAGVLCIADFDDLIVDPDLAALSPLVVNGFASEARVRGYFARHRDALELVDAASASTAPIADALARAAPTLPLGVARNGLSRAWLKGPADACERVADGCFRIGYFAGTRSHDGDFAEIAAELEAFVGASPARRLRLVGDLAAGIGRFPAGQVERVSAVDYATLPALLAGCDATLAPLVPNAFNHAKSRIKFIESAAVGTPHVNAPVADLDDHDASGLTLASGAGRWHAALDALAAETGLGRRRERLALRRHARERCTAAGAAESLLRLAGAGRAPPGRSSLERDGPEAAGPSPHRHAA